MSFDTEWPQKNPALGCSDEECDLPLGLLHGVWLGDDLDSECMARGGLSQRGVSLPEWPRARPCQHETMPIMCRA